MIEAASFEAEFVAGTAKIGAAGPVQRCQAPDHDFPRDRLAPGGIVDRVSVEPVNHSNLAVKFVHSITRKSQLIRLESNYGL